MGLLKLVSFGELLVDEFACGDRVPGGAPANVAIHASRLGASSSLISSVGKDVDGDCLYSFLRDNGVGTAALQRHASLPSGKVTVSTEEGQTPRYVIHENVAWDEIIPSDAAKDLCRNADIFCYGTLSQRGEISHNCLKEMLSCLPVKALRLFDANLRQHHWTPEILRFSLSSATAVKVSDEELPFLAKSLGLPGSPLQFAKSLIKSYDLEIVAVTLGGGGSLLVTTTASDRGLGRYVTVEDTVGAGDSFVAALAIGWLQKRDLAWINREANLVASFVCSQKGAVPMLPDEVVSTFKEGQQPGNSFDCANEKFAAAVPSRPHYHFTAATGWINDPNGLVFCHGEYHLFYQHNPFENHWGHMSWGHAVSKDLIVWEHLPVAIPESEGVMAYSGSCVFDAANCSKLGSPERPPIVALFSGHSEFEEDQRLAWSIDRGRKWNIYPENPILRNGTKEFRDPHVFWHLPSRAWIMTVTLGKFQKVSFYRSENLIDWNWLSDFGPAGHPLGWWECPVLWETTPWGSKESTWVLKIDLGAVDPTRGSCSQYFLGSFDGVKFQNQELPGVTKWVEGSHDFYAAQIWNGAPENGDREVLWLGWMNNWTYAGDIPSFEWRGQMTVPRLVSLRVTAQGLKLFQRPVVALQSLRKKYHFFEDISVEENNRLIRKNDLGGDVYELCLNCDLSVDSKITVIAREGEDEKITIGYDSNSEELFVNRRYSGATVAHPFFLERIATPLKFRNHLQMHIFVDRFSIEVFAADGEAVLTSLVFPSPASRGLRLETHGGDVVVSKFEFWELS